MPFTGFTPADYAANACVYDPDTDTLINPAVYQVTLSYTTVTDGINLVYTVTNPSATTSITPPAFDLKLGWNGTGDALTRMWSAQYKWDARTGHTPFASQQAWFYGLAGNPLMMACNCVAYDNGASGSDTVGVGCDYPYLTMIGERNSAATPRVYITPARDTGSQDRVIADWIRPGESKTYTFWLRRVSTTGLAQSLATVQPYIDYMQANVPSRRPRNLYGRVLAYFLSGPGAGIAAPGTGGRYYRKIPVTTGTDVDSFSGWSELLDAVVDEYGGIEAFRDDSHYRAIMFWAASGYAPALTEGSFLPSIWRNLPTNLATTKHEIAEWEAENGVEVFIYFGNTHSSIQLGAFDSAKESPLLTGEYESSTFDPDDWETWVLRDEAQPEFDLNMRAASDYVSGMSFDADPDATIDPWVLEQHARIKAHAPDVWFASESQKSDRGQQYAVTFFYPAYGESGTLYEGHCPLMEAIYPGHQNVVLVYADGSHLGYDDRVQFVESQGDCAIVQGTLLATADYLGVSEPAAISGRWSLDETTGNWTLEDDVDERTILIFVDADGNPQEWPQNHELEIGITDREHFTAIYLPGSGDGLNGYRIGVDLLDSSKISIQQIDEGIFSETLTGGDDDTPPNDFLAATHGYGAAEPFRLRVRTYDGRLEVRLDDDDTPIIVWTGFGQGDHAARLNYGFESEVGGAVVLRPLLYPLIERSASASAEVLVAVAAGRTWYSIGGDGISQIESTLLFRTGGMVALTDYDSFIYGADGKYHLKINLTVDPPTLTAWTASAGSFPFPGDGTDTYASIISSHIGRLHLAGSVEDPQNLIMTATGSPDDFDTAADEAGEAFYTGTGMNNKVGEPITCLYSLGQEVMLIGCLRSVWRMVGDPALGTAEITPVIRGIGITGQNAAAMVSEGLVATHGPDGVLLVSALGTPIELSRPVLSEGIQLPRTSPRDYYVSVVRDPLNHRVYFFLTPKDQTQGLHFVYDERIGGFQPGQGGFYPIQVPAEMGPTCAVYFQGRVLFGTFDGRICAFSDDATDDAGTPIESRLSLALVDAFDIGQDTVLNSVRVLPAMTSEDFTITAYGGRTPEEAFGSDRWTLFEVNVSADDPARAIRRRVRSAAIVLELSADSGRFAVEEVQVDAEAGPMLTRRRRVSPPVVGSSTAPPDIFAPLTGPGVGDDPEVPGLPPQLVEAAAIGAGSGFVGPGWLPLSLVYRRRGLSGTRLREISDRLNLSATSAGGGVSGGTGGTVPF